MRGQTTESEIEKCRYLTQGFVAAVAFMFIYTFMCTFHTKLKVSHDLWHIRLFLRSICILFGIIYRFLFYTKFVNIWYHLYIFYFDHIVLLIVRNRDPYNTMFIYNYFKGWTTEEDKDVIEKSIGAFGRFHFWLCFLVFLSKPPTALHQMAIIFFAPKISYTCDGVADKCPCDNPVYDKSMFTNSLIMEYNLICGRKWLASFTQSSIQFGTLLGCVCFGMASDRFGRRKPFIIAAIMELISGIGASYTSTYWEFLACRFVCGLAVGGTMVIGFVVLSEFVGVKYRATVACVYQLPATLGHLSMAAFGYFYRDYRDFQFAISTTPIVMLLYICFLPETPRWLMASKNNEKAIKVLERVAVINKRPTGNIRDYVYANAQVLERQHLQRRTILDLFRTPNIRKHSLAMAYSWFACGYCIYGIAQYVSHLTGNIFMNVAASALCTAVAALLSVCILPLMRRRTIVVTCHAICVVCFLILAVMPYSLIGVIVACIGIAAEFIVYLVVYLYTSELFPTVIRSAAMGFSSMCARIGSMIAPFVIDLSGIAPCVPSLVFALGPAVALYVTYLMPETKDCKLMTTIEEGEAFGKKHKHSATNTK